MAFRVIQARFVETGEGDQRQPTRHNNKQLLVQPPLPAMGITLVAEYQWALRVGGMRTRGGDPEVGSATDPARRMRVLLLLAFCRSVDIH